MKAEATNQNRWDGVVRIGGGLGAGILILVAGGCEPATETGSVPAETNSPVSTLLETPELPVANPVPEVAPEPIERNSFHEVTARLDSGGNLFVYLGTEQWLNRISDEYMGLKEVVTAIEGLQPQELAGVDTFFRLSSRLLRKSGLEQISGVGMSGIAVGEGRYRTKIFMHHYSGQGLGYLWKLAGEKPHELDGLDLMPKETCFGGWVDFDLRVLWDALVTEVEAVGTPEVKASFRQFPLMFKSVVEMDLYAVLDSLGGQFGFALLLDEEQKIPFPVDETTIQVPRPDLLLALRANDTKIFDRIAQLFEGMPNVKRTTEDGVSKLVVPPPFPFLPILQPAMVFDGEHLLIASSPGLVERALAVKAGETPGLRSHPEFVMLSADTPEEGNGFSFISERFGRQVLALRKQLARSADADNAGLGHALDQFYDRLTSASQRYGIWQNTDEGILFTGIDSRQPSRTLVEGMLFMPAGTLVSIAVPNFIKARATAQQNVCRSNLKAIHLATREWAIATRKKDDATPQLTGILRLLPGRQMPRCTGGGAYRLGETIGDFPSCSIAEHRLAPAE